MKHTLSKDEYRLLCNRLNKNGFTDLVINLSPRNLMINGISVVGISDTPEGTFFDYTEDGLTDEKGRPYVLPCIFSPIYGPLEKGTRLIVLYSDNKRLLLPSDPELDRLTDTQEKGFTSDNADMIRIPHLKFIDMPREDQRTLSDHERNMIVDLLHTQFDKDELVTSVVIAGVFSLLIIELLFIILVFIMKMNSPADLIAVSLIDLGILSFLIALIVRLTRNFETIFARRLKFIKPVLIGYYKSPSSGCGRICTWEWIDGNPVMQEHPLSRDEVYFNECSAKWSVVYRVSQRKAVSKESRSGLYIDPVFLSDPCLNIKV